jgi:hypothetical protein
MNIHTRSTLKIETEPLPGPSAVVRMADEPDLLAKIHDTANVVETLDLIFNDAAEPFQSVQPPTAEHGRQIRVFFKRHHQARTANLVFQCQAGVGRSRAAYAAFLKIVGKDPVDVFEQGTYNRRLYRSILNAAGTHVEPDPLVSIAVRVKYNAERLQLFLLSMRRQRYENWEVVAVSDGPNPAAKQLVEAIGDSRIRIIETDKVLGKWGHPYRQIGIDACRGEWIGLSNDDNYYVPGYIEQMVYAGRNADLVMCEFLHSYHGWRASEPGSDLGSWIARSDVVRRFPWPGVDFHADKIYLDLLKQQVVGRIATLKRALFVHN